MKHQMRMGRRRRNHPKVGLRENLRSISHRCHLFGVAFVWELTEETIHLPLSCLQGGACYGSMVGAWGLEPKFINLSVVWRPGSRPELAHKSVYSRCCIRICSAMVGVFHGPLLSPLPAAALERLSFHQGPTYYRGTSFLRNTHPPRITTVP